ncbi:unnamed protein product, partial [Staurois parvus]
MRGDQRVNCVLFHWLTVCCVCFTVQSNTKLCRAIQSSMLVLTGERSVLFTYRPFPCQCSSAIAGFRQGISGQDPVIEGCSHQWQPT